MEKQDNEQSCRAVYIEDMRALVSIYHSQRELRHCQSDGDSQASLTLQPDFGIPLAILQDGQQIIGFASAVCSNGKDVSINTCFQQHIAHDISKRTLALFSKEIWKHSFGDEYDVGKLTININNLLYWINQWN